MTKQVAHMTATHLRNLSNSVTIGIGQYSLPKIARRRESHDGFRYAQPLRRLAHGYGTVETPHAGYGDVPSVDRGIRCYVRPH